MSKRILLIDNDEDYVEMMRIRLISLGFDVVTAHNGSDGIAMAEKERPDLILLDLMMPGMDGGDVWQAIKLNPETAGIPVIFQSSLVDEEVAARLKDAGTTGEYISKGISHGGLLARINAVLGLH